MIQMKADLICLHFFFTGIIVHFAENLFFDIKKEDFLSLREYISSEKKGGLDT